MISYPGMVGSQRFTQLAEGQTVLRCRQGVQDEASQFAVRTHRCRLQFRSQLDEGCLILVIGAGEERKQARGLIDDFFEQYRAHRRCYST